MWSMGNQASNHQRMGRLGGEEREERRRAETNRREEDSEKTTQGANRVRLLEGEKEKSENNKHKARGPNAAHRVMSCGL